MSGLKTRYDVVGFVGQYSGASDLLQCFRPVLRSTEGLAVPILDDWCSQEDFHALAPDEYDYVNLGIGEAGYRTTVKPGTLIWLAGSTFVSAVRSDLRLRVQSGFLNTWSKYRGGFSYAYGSRQEFVELCRKLYGDVEVAFLNSLYSDNTMLSSEDLFNVLSNLAAELPEKRTHQLVLEGLLYWELRDVEQLNLTRQFVVDERLFRSYDDFDKAWNDLRDALRPRRLREVPQEGEFQRPRLMPRDTNEQLDELIQSWMQIRLRSSNTLVMSQQAYEESVL